MRTQTTRILRAAVWLLTLVGLPALTGAAARAQVSPLWDHYKAYQLNPPFAPFAPISVALRDQFGAHDQQAFQLELFANPVTKTHALAQYPIVDSLLHYSWWRINTLPANVTVIATNQFGDRPLTVGNSVYLWNPASKDTAAPPPPPPPPSNRNHYKCYECQGTPVNVSVLLVDQFGACSSFVTLPRLFCNPVEKRVGPAGGGQVHPIVDPNQHYVCYEFTPEDPRPFNASMSDQFFNDIPMTLHPSRLLCVPTYKQIATPTNKNTWGRLKVLYR